MYPAYVPSLDPLRLAISQAYRQDETQCVERLLQTPVFSGAEAARVQTRAQALVLNVRAARKKEGGVDAFMREYDLSSEEGIALMCLAEALLRIPDAATMDKLIEDKLGSVDWEQHAGESDSWFVNAATWSLMLTGKIYHKEEGQSIFARALKNLVARSGSAVIRQIARQGMKILGKQFVTGRTIEEALSNAQIVESLGYVHSYDMLGEAARTQVDADRYFQAYVDAIHAIGRATLIAHPQKTSGISVKLSAIHPRYEVAKHQRVMGELVPKLKALVLLAKQYQIGLTVDAEEADRLELSLDIIEAVYLDSELAGYEGFGLAVQAYQKRAPYVLDWLVDLVRRGGRKLMVRLVKGAYWDYELKQAQVLGMSAYPVYTRKNNTDLSYLVCAKKLLGVRDLIYPQFATHNAHTVASIIEWAGDNKDYEFQCLHGMGRSLYDEIVPQHLCRIYAPVGHHEDLLAYLVRRLLENGANTSFVNRITDENEPVAHIVADPVARVARLSYKPHPRIPLPKDIYGPDRVNSMGLDLSSPLVQDALFKAMAPFFERPLPDVVHITPQACEPIVNAAVVAQSSWDALGPVKRADILLAIAELFEVHQSELMSVVVYEARKTLPDAIAEVREAIDFCRYYAQQAKQQLTDKALLGPTGESNQLRMHGRGVFLCISPWNFPLAIFTGQVVAALVAGNAVLAKPAEQTSRIAARAVELMHQAGVPQDILTLVPGRGSVIGAAFVANPAVKGIMFTGSTETARLIQCTLAAREGEMIPFIAETGGQNTMIVDSSALPEQVVADVVSSAFGSAGQRCSALRVLFLQEDTADKIITMLKGAMAELVVGDPRDLATDIGPVIDQMAKDALEQHAQRMEQEATLIYRVPAVEEGCFFAPRVFEIRELSVLTREVFGPILHIIRYKASALSQVVEAINRTGYGLTFGVHSRIQQMVKQLSHTIRAGNIYVNRTMIGAVVGVQPFGGEGLSGTGPKAGGPYYLPRLCVERTISINTTASGGNATLLSLSEEDDT